MMPSYGSLVPRPPPRLYLVAVEFLHGCEIKSGRRPGNEANHTELIRLFHSQNKIGQFGYMH